MAEDKDFEKNITFHLIKSPMFRTIHVDGVFGGTTPRGFINMGLYSERSPFPKQTTYTIAEDGTLGDEIRDIRVQRDGPVREIEVNAVMDLRLAKSLIEWLNSKIDAVEKRESSR